MIEFLDKVISDILINLYGGIKGKANILAKNKIGIKKYLSNLKIDIDQIYLHRSNSKKEISKIFIDLKLMDIVLSELYTKDTSNITDELERRKIGMAIKAKNTRNPKKKVIKNSSMKINFNTKEQILSNYSNIIILGQPGSGKTTLLKKIILDKIKKKKIDHIPVFIPLRSPLLLDMPIELYISTQFKKYGINEPLKLVDKLLKTGKLLIAYDGIDEVSIENKQSIIEQILNITTEYPGNLFIASSRLADYRGELNQFKEFEICEFSENDIENFVKNWFTSFPNEVRYISLIQKIQAFPQIAEISTSPLLLSLICVVYEYDLEISSRRTTLYKRCVECLIRDWDAQRNFRRKSSYSKLDDPKKIMLLSELAYKLHNDHRLYFENIHLQNYLEDSMEKYGLKKINIFDVIEEIKSHYGFILEVSKGVFSFSHLTFQEYFAANYVVMNSIWKEEIDNHFEEPFWNEVFILSSSLFADATNYINYIFNKQSKWKMNLILAGLCLEVDPIIDRGLKERIVKDILLEYHNHADKEMQRKCLSTISRIDETFVGRELLNSLNVSKMYLEKIRKEKLS